MNRRGKVVSVNISPEKGVRKVNVVQSCLLPEFGLKDDAHAGKWHRQVSLLAMESIGKMVRLGLQVGPGDFAENIILAICQNRIWLKKYPIRLALVSHPKTPLSVAVKFLDHLHDKDLKALSRDKNISSALAQIAWQVFAKRKR